MSHEEIYTRETNTVMILGAGHSMPAEQRHIKIPGTDNFYKYAHGQREQEAMASLWATKLFTWLSS